MDQTFRVILERLLLSYVMGCKRVATPSGFRSYLEELGWSVESCSCSNGEWSVSARPPPLEQVTYLFTEAPGD